MVELFGASCGHDNFTFGFSREMFCLLKEDAINVNRLDEADQSKFTNLFLAVTQKPSSQNTLTGKERGNKSIGGLRSKLSWDHVAY